MYPRLVLETRYSFVHGLTRVFCVSRILIVSTVIATDIVGRHGPSLIGTFLNVFLYGIMCAQCFVYYARYPQ